MAGKKVHNKVWEEYGEIFGRNDTVGAFLDIAEDTVTMTFTKNGQTQVLRAFIYVLKFPIINVK